MWGSFDYVERRWAERRESRIQNFYKASKYTAKYNFLDETGQFRAYRFRDSTFRRLFCSRWKAQTKLGDSAHLGICDPH